METSFPTADGYSGIFITGFRRSEGATQLIGSVIIKRAYVVDVGTLVPEPGGEAIRLSDQVDPPIDPDDLPFPENPPPDPRDVLHEADIAAYKPRADLIVKAHLGAGGGQVRVGGATWLTRSEAGVADQDDDPDAHRHLFGWEPRASTRRRDEAGAHTADDPPTYPNTLPPVWPIPPGQPEADPLPPGYENAFLNAHRRTGGGFTAATGASIPNAVAVEIFQTEDAADTVYDFELDLPELTARYFTWGGRGPDRETRWCPVDLGALRPDTLVVTPDEDRAYVLWRAVWGYEDHPADRYRRLVVTEGGV